MTLYEWEQKYKHRVDEHPNGCFYVVINQFCSYRPELFQLTDYTVSGITIWLTPRTK